MKLRYPSFFALLLGLLLAFSSAVSASRMAPDREGLERALYEASFGALTSGLCGDLGHEDEHHCPFCHGLPEAAKLGFSGVERRFVPQDVRSIHQAFWLKPQRRSSRHAIRAPPRSVIVQ